MYAGLSLAFSSTLTMEAICFSELHVATPQRLSMENEETDYQTERLHLTIMRPFYTLV
jgi:hypothetical protein